MTSFCNRTETLSDALTNFCYWARNVSDGMTNFCNRVKIRSDALTNICNRAKTLSDGITNFCNEKPTNFIKLIVLRQILNFFHFLLYFFNLRNQFIFHVRDFAAYIIAEFPDFLHFRNAHFIRLVKSIKRFQQN
jgi:hypothetical protein